MNTMRALWLHFPMDQSHNARIVSSVIFL